MGLFFAINYLYFYSLIAVIKPFCLLIFLGVTGNIFSNAQFIGTRRIIDEKTVFADICGTLYLFIIWQKLNVLIAT